MEEGNNKSHNIYQLTKIIELFLISIFMQNATYSKIQEHCPVRWTSRIINILFKSTFTYACNQFANKIVNTIMQQCVLEEIMESNKFSCQFT